MGIEKMKRITALVPAEILSDFTAHLHDLAVLHVTSVDEELPAQYQPPQGADNTAQDKAGKLEQVMSFCEGWGAGKRSFLESIFPAKTCASAARIREAAGRVDAEALHQRVNDLRTRRDRLLQRLSALDKETERLLVFAPVGLPLASLTRLKHLRIVLARASQPIVDELQLSCPEGLAWEPLAGGLIWLAYRPGDDAAA